MKAEYFKKLNLIQIIGFLSFLECFLFGLALLDKSSIFARSSGEISFFLIIISTLI